VAKSKPEQVAMFTNETIVIPEGQTKYWILAEDDEIEKLASGRVPRRIVEQAYAMLGWKREAAQDWESHDDDVSRLPVPVQVRR
jgi:hypothetical protein